MDVPGPVSSDRRPRKSAALAAVLGLLCPGLAQFYVGRPGRGAWLLFVVLATFGTGLLLTEGRGVTWDTSSVWFYAHVLATGPTALASCLTRDLTLVHRIATWDAGLLYCAVAGLLNVVVLADALSVVDEVNSDADARETHEREQRAAAAAAAAANPAPSPEGTLPAGGLAAVPAAAGDPPLYAEGLPPPPIPPPPAPIAGQGALPDAPTPEGAA